MFSFFYPDVTGGSVYFGHKRHLAPLNQGPLGLCSPDGTVSGREQLFASFELTNQGNLIKLIM